MDEIKRIIEEQIDNEVQNKMTIFIEYISNTYGISMKVLLRDFEKMANTERTVVTSSKQCMGVNASNKKRCKFAAGPCGYCKKHLDQYKPPRPVPPPSPVSTVKHNHPVHTLFCPDCPSCQKNKNQSKDNLLIDFR